MDWSNTTFGSSFTDSLCNCYYGQGNISHAPLDMNMMYNVNQMPFYMTQPLVYYASVPPSKGNKKRPNVFVRAFHWYTNERGAVYRRQDPKPMTNNDNTDAFVTWLDAKFDQFLIETNQPCRKETRSVIKDSIRDEVELQSLFIPEPKHICTEECGKKCPVEVILPPKNISRAASYYCQPSPTPDDQVSCKIHQKVVISRSATAILQTNSLKQEKETSALKRDEQENETCALKQDEPLPEEQKHDLLKQQTRKDVETQSKLTEQKSAKTQYDPDDDNQVQNISNASRNKRVENRKATSDSQKIHGKFSCHCFPRHSKDKVQKSNIDKNQETPTDIPNTSVQETSPTANKSSSPGLQTESPKYQIITDNKSTTQDVRDLNPFAVTVDTTEHAPTFNSGEPNDISTRPSKTCPIYQKECPTSNCPGPCTTFIGREQAPTFNSEPNEAKNGFSKTCPAYQKECPTPNCPGPCTTFIGREQAPTFNSEPNEAKNGFSKTCPAYQKECPTPNCPGPCTTFIGREQAPTFNSEPNEAKNGSSKTCPVYQKEYPTPNCPGPCTTFVGREKAPTLNSGEPTETCTAPSKTCPVYQKKCPNLNCRGPCSTFVGRCNPKVPAIPTCKPTACLKCCNKTCASTCPSSRNVCRNIRSVCINKSTSPGQNIVMFTSTQQQTPFEPNSGDNNLNSANEQQCCAYQNDIETIENHSPKQLDQVVQTSNYAIQLEPKYDLFMRVVCADKL